ncbi:hypothetical protein DV515_00010927 [Chloebia gouldiae]|uniref:Uncharacterized protein n=1 Tax=Chloebia gouldiae TaxID=44316 RepID=A0A3L8S7R2_CHLGU|nr:hypothetical protein DV515_00010927 [Chloebia gouldiae]
MQVLGEFLFFSSGKCLPFICAHGDARLQMEVLNQSPVLRILFSELTNEKLMFSARARNTKSRFPAKPHQCTFILTCLNSAFPMTETKSLDVPACCEEPGTSPMSLHLGNEEQTDLKDEQTIQPTLQSRLGILLLQWQEKRESRGEWISRVGVPRGPPSNGIWIVAVRAVPPKGPGALSSLSAAGPGWWLGFVSHARRWHCRYCVGEVPSALVRAGNLGEMLQKRSTVKRDTSKGLHLQFTAGWFLLRDRCDFAVLLSQPPSLLCEPWWSPEAEKPILVQSYIPKPDYTLVMGFPATYILTLQVKQVGRVLLARAAVLTQALIASVVTKNQKSGATLEAIPAFAGTESRLKTKQQTKHEPSEGGVYDCYNRNEKLGLESASRSPARRRVHEVIWVTAAEPWDKLCPGWGAECPPRVSAERDIERLVCLWDRTRTERTYDAEVLNIDLQCLLVGPEHTKPGNGSDVSGWDFITSVSGQTHNYRVETKLSK